MQQKEADAYARPAENRPGNVPLPDHTDFIFKCRGKSLPLRERTHIMGILNLTPDSFHDGGRYSDVDSAVRHAGAMIEEGADIIDIGGESTRPGSSGVTEEEELGRVMPVIREIRKRFDTVLSIDTTKERVAREALSEGVSIVNDISGLTYSHGLAEAAAEYGAGIVVMHTPSRPADMQYKTGYHSLIDDILDSLGRSAGKAIEAGVGAGSIIVDPGFGFGKTAEQNLAILKNLARFGELGFPVMIGTSNKSFIGAITGGGTEDRLLGTAATVAIGVINGASLVRVHDVPQMRRVVRMADAAAGKNNSSNEG
ncbi:MAG TPA: dihydropteroate synthase [Thermodesulfobacteriota bacterium]|nr:dihydropteroate synthase [Thermodesulfobacteriota bacterium]